MDGAIEVSDIEYWAALGRLEEVIQAFAANPDVNLRSEGGHTALHAAVENGYLDVVCFLVEHGADLSARLDSGESALDLARLTGRDDIIAYLTARGAG